MYTKLICKIVHSDERKINILENILFLVKYGAYNFVHRLKEAYLVFLHIYTRRFTGLTIYVLWLVQSYINQHYLRKLYRGVPKKEPLQKWLTWFIMTIN